jgi:hypothetical protein
MPAFPIVGKYLFKVLTEEIHAMSNPDVFNKYRDACAIGDAMCSALVGYTYQDPEYRFKKGMTPMKYWKQLHKDLVAEVLVVCCAVY